MTKTEQPISIRKNMWRNIFFIGGITAGALIGMPIYLWQNGFHAADWILFAFMVFATGMSITVGYHRLYAHKTFSANPLLHFFSLFFGAAAFEQSALDWSAQHRDHHRYVDTDADPYSIKKGFFYAHVGWLLFWDHEIRYENVPDLQQNKMLVNQDRYYYLWSLGAGVALPLLVGYLTTGSAWGAFWIAVCFRIFLVYNSTFFINSVCHTFGTATYDVQATARDHWFVAILTNGEGYHNFHHKFPNDYRNGVRWYHWDPSKWFIRFSSFLGLAKDLRRTPDEMIRRARLAALEKRNAVVRETQPVF